MVLSSKAKRFFNSSVEFEIGGNSGINIPYYLPIKNNSDIKFTPKLIFSENSNEFISNYELNTLLNHKMSGGNLSLEINNIKNANEADINTTAKMNFKQVLNKNKVLSFNGLITNSVSTTRSINEDPIKFENIYLKLHNYDLFHKNDFLEAEIATVEAFDSTNVSYIPLTPTINYQNNIKFNKNISNLNEINFSIMLIY